jgi:hypothetical protein
MGLDTRAYAKSTHEWRQHWVVMSNERGWRPVMFGLMAEPVGQRNYGLKGGYAGGRAPFTIDDAPSLHQDGLDELPWPGGLVGGMISSNGDGPSFRGKAYAGYVEGVTGESLYACIDDPWEGEILRSITEQLEEAATTNGVDRYDVPMDERAALARWFRVCVDHDLAVSGDA